MLKEEIMLSEEGTLKRIVDKIISRGGINASQDKLDLSMFDDARQAVITNAFANFWYEDGKRLEEKGRKYEEHHVAKKEDDTIVLVGDLGIAGGWFNYVVMMFKRTIPKFRSQNLKTEILSHIIEFATDYGQKFLLERAEELKEETPDVVRNPVLKTSEFYAGLPDGKKVLKMKADDLAAKEYVVPYTERYHLEFQMTAFLYGQIGESELSRFCGQDSLKETDIIYSFELRTDSLIIQQVQQETIPL